MRWIIYGDILSHHAVDSLISALSDAGHEVSLLDGPRDHDRTTRANLWRSAA
jgi:hypothetical protein